MSLLHRVFRPLVVVATLTACVSAPAAPPIPMDDPAYSAPREQTADQQVAHLLNRLAFGARPGDVERVRAMGPDAWFEQQLAPNRIADTSLTVVASIFPTTQQSVTDLLSDYPDPAQFRRKSQQMMKDGTTTLSADDSAQLKTLQQKTTRMTQEANAERVARAVLSNRQLEEVMTDFWLNHFSVFAGKGGPMRHYLASYEREAIRPHALGRFRDLLGAVAKSPAMLFYLDQWQSVANPDRPTLEAPGRIRAAMVRRAESGAMGPLVQQVVQNRGKGLNENYARELLELHTLGVDGGYTQQDVIEVARALTGWTIDQPYQKGAFIFRPTQHDAGEKMILGVRFAEGRGIEDGEQVLDLIARHPATAKFIATKLVRRFVSDTPPAGLVERAAATFQRTDGDIAATLRTIVRGPEFFARSSYRAKVKSPFELVVSALRALDAVPDTTPRTSQVIGQLGQPIYGHQAPNGWPETGGEWINTGSILNRINFGITVASGRLPGAAPLGWAGSDLASVQTATRGAQVDVVVHRFLNGEISPEMRAVLMSGDHPMLAKGGMAPTDTSAKSSSAVLAQIVGLTLGSPEFQRR